MVLDVIAYNAAISLCEGHWQRALGFLREMQELLDLLAISPQGTVQNAERRLLIRTPIWSPLW